MPKIAPDFWIIHNKPGKPPVPQDLHGLRIQQLSGGGYELQVPGGPVLKITLMQGFPVVFDNVPRGSKNWKITATNLPPGLNGEGKWQLLDTETDTSQDGEYTAQAGAGAGEDCDEAASSAKA